MIFDANNVATPLEMASRVSDALRTMSADSLPEYTAPTRLSPVVLIDKTVLDVDHGQLRALLQTMASMYSAWYLQAINLSMTVGDVRVMRLLDQFSNDRDILRAAGNSTFLGMESYSQEAFLPTFGEDEKPLRPGKDNDKSIKFIQDESNLAVGKLIEVKIQSDGNHISIPVTLTLTPKIIKAEDLVSITEANSVEKTLLSRWHQWRSGEIRFVQDFLLCQDLLEADRKALLADPTKTLLAERSKRTKNILATLLSGRASPNAVSTMVVVSKGTAEQMEFQLKGKLKSSRTRDEYFKSNVAMMLIVVDTIMERFTVYHRGIDQYGEYTLEDIKANGTKPSGVDIESLMKAYKLGEAPTL